MLRTRVRKIGSGIGALALVAGFAGGAAGVALGASALTATVAGASGHTYKCTLTDNQSHATSTTGTKTYTSAAALNVTATLAVAHNTDTLVIHCTGLPDSSSFLFVEVSGLALFATSGGITETVLERYVDFSHVSLTDKTNGSGVATFKVTATYVDGTSQVTCPVNQGAANVGAVSCAFVAVSKALTSHKTVGGPTTGKTVSTAHVDGVWRLHYLSPADATPTTPHIALTRYTVNGATATSPIKIHTTSGLWWGASNDGTCPLATLTPTTGCVVPNPAVLITGTPIATVGSTGSADLVASKANFIYGGSTPTYTGPSTPGPPTGVFVDPVLSGGTTVVLPKGLTPGEHTLTVSELTVAGGSHATWVPADITASASFYVPGRAVTPTSGAVPVGQIGPTTGFKIGPTKGWDNDPDSSFSAYWVAPVSCTAATGHIPATSLQATPTHPSTTTGTETFHFNTSDVAPYFSTATCVGGAHDQWTIHVNQHVTDPATVTATFGPITLVNLASTCHITYRSNNATPTHTSKKATCLVQQAISQHVTGTTLLVYETAATTGINAPAGNPSPIQVNLEKVTLGPGVFQAGQGMLNTVTVNDQRGSLSGWTVTGVLTSDFHGPDVGFDHTIPADYLTWNPSVSLTFPGNLQATVVPDGTKSPPVYAPDSCHHGTSSHLNGGSNANIKCPTLATVHGLKSDDSAGTTNPAGKTNRTTSPSNHADVEPWPSATAEGPSGLLYEVKAGPVANMGTSTTGAPDYSARGPQLLCKATAGGGGGSFNCTASLSLAVPPYIAAGSYSATMDILTVAS